MTVLSLFGASGISSFHYLVEDEMRREKRLKKIVTVAGLICAGIVIAVLAVNFWQAGTGTATNVPGAEETHEITEAERMDVSGISLAGRKIIVDAGHGGFDQGCTGVSGRLEKEVNLEIAEKLQALLEAEGATVIMTRSTDDALGASKEEDMEARKQIILNSDADMFVSIHQNMYEEDPEKSGPQVFYAYHGTPGKKLALAVQEMLNYELEIAKPRMALDVAYDILKPGSQPSCTVECGFFSNPEEEEKLQTDEYQQELVQAIADGLKLYLKQNTDAGSAPASDIPSLGSPARTSAQTM